MGTKSRPAKSRIPVEVDGIQVNACRNPFCANFGVIPKPNVTRGRTRKGTERVTDTYLIDSKTPGIPTLECQLCKEEPPIKSNLAITEELTRYTRFLQATEDPTCPTEGCLNQFVPLSKGGDAYYAHGHTKSGNPRYFCRLCKHAFTVNTKATLRQRQSSKNKDLFKALLNQVALSRCLEMYEINPKTLYQRINFFQKQCLAFVGDRERELVNGKSYNTMSICTDRQMYAVNWNKSNDRRNIMLMAIGSADNISGCVFAMHLNFDPEMDPSTVEADAEAVGDYEAKLPFRRYARVWLQQDYQEAIKKPSNVDVAEADLFRAIAEAYSEANSRDDVELLNNFSELVQLPYTGMQVRLDISMYAHFQYLKRLLPGVEKYRFYFEQESGMRAACFSAFTDEIKQRRVDAFYVRINKTLKEWEKRRETARLKKKFEEIKGLLPGRTDEELRLLMIRSRMRKLKPIGHWGDRWLEYPIPDITEPQKAVCCLTDLGGYDEKGMAKLYLWVSLHAIDRFFMQGRRRVRMIERAITSASKKGRWHGYSPYNPEMITKLLDMYRVYYNYCLVGKDKKTPAMRLGLAKGPVEIEKILSFKEVPERPATSRKPKEPPKPWAF